MIGTLCVVGVAWGEPTPLTLADYAGRWVSTDKKLTLDLSRCGENLCGVAVAGETCGHTALRTSGPGAGALPQPLSLELSGQLRLASNTQPYGIHATLTRADGDLILHIAGHTGGVFAPMRRRYDYHAAFARAGEAKCAPDPKTS